MPTPLTDSPGEKMLMLGKGAIAFDTASLALQAGTVLSLNMVMMGALAQTGAIPLDPELFRQAIREKTKQTFVETNDGI